MQNPTPDDAILYVLGLLERGDAIAFEHRLCADRDLASLCHGLAQVAASVLIAEARRMHRSPSARLRECLANRIDSTSQMRYPGPVVQALRAAHFEPPSCLDAVVLANRAGHVRWVNPAFTALCGYTLEELRDHTPGSFLRGPDSEPDSIVALGEAVHRGKPLLRRIVNYHKNGAPYRVEIDLRPVPEGFVAVERPVDQAAEMSLR